MFTAVLISSTVWATLNALLARRQGRNRYQWFILGFRFGAIGLGFLFFRPKKKAPIPVAAAPTPKASPLIYWYYLDGESRHGPMSSDALKKALNEDKITEDTLVWHEELNDWQKLSIQPFFKALT